MDNIRSYVIGIVCAAVVCAITTNICSSKGANAAIIRLLAGIFMAVTVVAPLSKLKINQIVSSLDNITVFAQQSAQYGSSEAEREISKVIQQQTQAYVVEKAASYGAELSAEVTVSDCAPHLPQEIRITGTIAPYAREQLRRIIRDDLGIPEEHQFWN